MSNHHCLLEILSSLTSLNFCRRLAQPIHDCHSTQWNTTDLELWMTVMKVGMLYKSALVWPWVACWMKLWTMCRMLKKAFYLTAFLQFFTFSSNVSNLTSVLMSCPRWSFSLFLDFEWQECKFERGSLGHAPLHFQASSLRPMSASFYCRTALCSWDIDALTIRRIRRMPSSLHSIDPQFSAHLVEFCQVILHSGLAAKYSLQSFSATFTFLEAS